MKFIIGQKKEMTQIFKDDGTVVPVTVVQAGPCPIVAVKTVASDGYSAAVVGLPGKKKLAKRELGQTRNFGNLVFFREFRIDENSGLKAGDLISVETFAVGDKVKVTGRSKGKGFQGVVRRHGFHGQGADHGNKDQERSPGSIGAGGVQRVFPGMRMAGHMGDRQISVKNLVVARIDPEKNEIYIKGAVPGSRHGFLLLSAEGDLRVNLLRDKNSSVVATKDNSSSLATEDGQKETDFSAEQSILVNPDGQASQSSPDTKDTVSNHN